MATIPANNNTGLYNTSGTAATTGNDITVTGNVNANNINAVNTVNAGTNITAGGNVTAAYFIGDGSMLTNIDAGNIVGGYGNSNVNLHLAAFGSNVLSTTGNVTAGYFIGDGSQLTGLAPTYGNANVAAFLASGSDSSNIITSGNIAGTYFIGDGSQLTGLPATYGNAQVAAFLPTYTGNLAGGNASITNDLTVGGTIYGTFSGNIAGNLVVPGANTEVIYNNNGNAGASANFKFDSAASVLSVTGNVTATQFNGSGAGLTNLPGANVTGQVANALVAGTVYTAAQPNITSVGTLTSLTTSGNVTVGGSLNSDDITSTGNVTVNGNQIITGNLTVQGTTTTINSNTITTNDKTITVANNQSTGALVDGAGLEAGNPAIATWYYNNATTSWQSNIAITPTANGTLSLGTNTNRWDTIYGTGANITGNITGGNIIGTYLYGDGSNITGVVSGSQSVRVAVKNTSGGSLAKGTPVYATGTVGATDVLEVSASRADTASTMPAIGLLDAALANNGTGYAISVGSLTGVDTSTYSVGVVLYVAATGGLTATRPTGTNLVQPLGTVGRVNASNGTIDTNIWNYFQLPNLSNGKIWQGNATGYPTEVTPYGNANVAAYLPTYSGNIGNIASDLKLTGNSIGLYGLNGVAAIGLSNSGADTFITTAGATRVTLPGASFRADLVNVDFTYDTTMTGVGLAVNGNLFGTGNSITTTGNIATLGIKTDGYYYANGTPVTFGGGSTYGNSNVTTLLAALGSNVISSTGNITTTANISGAYVIGNGSALSSITGANVVGTVANATYATSAGTAAHATVADSANAVAGANVTGTVASATHATIADSANAVAGANVTGTVGLAQYVTANAQANITSVGSLTSLAVVGNTTSGNISVTGTVVAGGNISGNYILGNGSQLTGLTSTYGNSNVTSLLANFGSNVISTTGNVTAGYINTTGVSGNITGANYITANYFAGNGSLLTGITSSYGDANVATFLGAFGSNTISTTGTITGGNITGGNLITSGVVVASSTTNSHRVGNLQILNQQVQTTGTANVGLTTSIVPNPGQIVYGAGYNGNISPAYDIGNAGRGSRLVISDSYGITDGNSLSRALGIQNFVTLNANVTSTNARLQGSFTAIQIGGGSAANTITGAGLTAVAGGVSLVNIGGGTSGNLTGLGNTVVQNATGTVGLLTVNAGSTGGNINGIAAAMTNAGTANTMIGFVPQISGGGTFSGNVYAYYNPSGVNQVGASHSNAARNATNYYAFRNDDDVAQMKLGSLRLFHEYEYALSSSAGALTVDKNNGQVQFLTVSEAITSVTFSNFVTSASTGTVTKYQTDTVTIIVQQDATGRTITMPAASATYKYAGGSATVPATASSVSMISITAIYNTVTAAVQYLITISPEFN